MQEIRAEGRKFPALDQVEMQEAVRSFLINLEQESTHATTNGDALPHPEIVYASWQPKVMQPTLEVSRNPYKMLMICMNMFMTWLTARRC